jgi:hypothetical protein
MEGTQSILKIYGEQDEAGPFGVSFHLCPPTAAAGHHMPSITAGVLLIQGDKALSLRVSNSTFT